MFLKIIFSNQIIETTLESSETLLKIIFGDQISLKLIETVLKVVFGDQIGQTFFEIILGDRLFPGNGIVFYKSYDPEDFLDCFVLIHSVKRIARQRIRRQTLKLHENFDVGFLERVGDERLRGRGRTEPFAQAPAQKIRPDDLILDVLIRPTERL